MSIDPKKSFEEQLAEATSPEDIRQICINREVAARRMTVDRDGTTRLVMEPAPTGPTVQPHPALAVREDHLREKVVYPSGNVRVVITGTTDAEIVEAEKRIRAAYAQGL